MIKQEVINKINELKLKDDSSGLRQNAVIDKVLKILKEYVDIAEIVDIETEKGVMYLGCSKCENQVYTYMNYCPHCGIELTRR